MCFIFFHLGKIVRFLQQEGEEVAKDQPYVEVEAMKMIMAIKSSESGIVKHNLSPGSVIQAGIYNITFMFLSYRYFSLSHLIKSSKSKSV